MREALLIARLSFLRLSRQLPWKVLLFMGLPALYCGIAAAAGKGGSLWKESFETSMTLLVFVPSLLVAPVIAEEVDAKTYTFLWTRPIPRWSVLVGKLSSVVPLVVLLLVISQLAAAYFAHPSADVLVRSCVGLAVGGVSVSLVAASLGILAPGHPVAFTIVYMIMFDMPVSALPFELKRVSITHYVREAAGLAGDASVWIAFSALIPGLLAICVATWRLYRPNFGLKRER